MRTGVMLVLLLAVGHISGCASSGRLKYADKTYELNRSTFEKEEDGGYRIWAWRYEAGLLEWIGGSPAGIQMWLPDTTASGGTYEVGNDCGFWVRGPWSLVGAWSGTMWLRGESGTIRVETWNPDGKTVEGTFEAETQEGPVSGVLRVRPDTQD